MAPKTIALVDWCWGGHHPTYFSHFMVAMEDLGHHVLGLCPEPREAWENWNLIRRRPEEDLAGKFAQSRIPVHRFTALRPRRLSAIDFSWRLFRGVESDAKKLAARSGRTLDLVFYAGINDWDFEWIHTVARFLKTPWSGLYMHASSLRQTPPSKSGMHQRMFGSPLCRAVAVLDEGVAAQLGRSFGKPVVAFPDITDMRGAGGETVISSRLVNFAAGRPIVGLLGYLEPRKGVLPFLRMANEARNEKICFALAGQFAMPNNGEDFAEFKGLVSSLPNLWCHFFPVDDGPEFNALLSACDVLFAAYLNFPHSSNLLTKSALLEKPIIVSEGFLMAERVKKYRMGEVIREGNVKEGLAAIKNLVGGKKRDNSPLFKEYYSKHNPEALKDAMNSVIESCSLS